MKDLNIEDTLLRARKVQKKTRDLIEHCERVIRLLTPVR